MSQRRYGINSSPRAVLSRTISVAGPKLKIMVSAAKLGRESGNWTFFLQVVNGLVGMMEVNCADDDSDVAVSPASTAGGHLSMTGFNIGNCKSKVVDVPKSTLSAFSAWVCLPAVLPDGFNGVVIQWDI